MILFPQTPVLWKCIIIFLHGFFFMHIMIIHSFIKNKNKTKNLQERWLQCHLSLSCFPLDKDGKCLFWAVCFSPGPHQQWWGVDLRYSPKTSGQYLYSAVYFWDHFSQSRWTPHNRDCYLQTGLSVLHTEYWSVLNVFKITLLFHLRNVCCKHTQM